MRRVRYRHPTVVSMLLEKYVRLRSFKTNLETGGTPIHELDSPLGLDACDGSLDVLGHDITTVQEAACHYQRVRSLCRLKIKKTDCICPL
jgi:hypothetical protein